MYIVPVILAFLLALPVVAQEQRLRPWLSIPAGTVLPEENDLSGAWTTAERNALSPRIVQSLNRHWTFTYNPDRNAKWESVADVCDDSTWPAISLPHTWQTYETTREQHPFIHNPSERDSTYWWYGWGFYRKTFSFDRVALTNRKLFVEFDGVMKYAKVYLNGRCLAEHRGGYASWEVDLTDSIRFDKPNVLALRVSGRRDDPDHIPPMTAGNFNTYAGIYRDVRLVLKNRVHIPFQGSAGHEGGTFVTTPQVSADCATVRVRTWVKNDSPQPRTITLRTTVVDPAGRGIITRDIAAELAADELHEFDQSDFAVDRPQLWSCESPVLYRVESEVRIGDTAVDRYASPLGFRWFTWNAQENRGYLNGKQLHIHGTNRHQEFPWLGDAMPKWMHVRDLYDMRFGLGHNFARFTHYTQDSLVYDLADRWGLLVCEEVPNIKDLAFGRDVQKQQVIEMIRRDRNHPSIVMWSMGNESNHPADSAWAHAEDPTRILHLRHCDPRLAGDYITHTHQNMDMENLLRCSVRGWTHSDVADLQPRSGQSTGTEAWQHSQAMIQDASQRGRIDMPNGVMWLYADHGADREYANCPLMHINPKGWTDISRVPKYMYFLWQAQYTDKPMVFIQPHFFAPRYLGQKRDITVDSNGDRVELLLNNQSLGTLKPAPDNFHSVTFKNVPIEQGTLTARAMRSGKAVTTRVTLAGQPARVELAASHLQIPAARESIALITADILDAAGIPVRDYTGDLRWSVTGPATLLAPELFRSDIARRNADTGTFYITAPASTLIRATGQAGDIVLTVSTGNIPPASITIRTVDLPLAAPVVREFPLTDTARKPLAPDPAAARPPKPNDRMSPAGG